MARKARKRCLPPSSRSRIRAAARILLDREIPDADLLVAALSASAERKVQLKWNVRGERAMWNWPAATRS